MRTAIMVGGGFGLVAVLFVFLFNAQYPALLMEAILAVVAGAVTAYLAGRALLDAALDQVLPDKPAKPVPAMASPRRSNAGEGATARAIVGVLGAIAYTVVVYNLFSGGASRDQIQQIIDQQGLKGTSPDSLMTMIVGCAGCLFLFLIPSLTAGTGALGAWLYGLTRPAPAAPPPPPAQY